ncbi:hypothetical protein IAU59_001857 [Kwoniella sp. CBS 9459]
MSAGDMVEYVISTDETGGASCDSTQLTMLASVSTYVFEQCYTYATLEVPAEALIRTASNPEECLHSCVDYEVAAWYVSENGFTCACTASSNFNRGDAAACGPGRPYVATHTVGDSINSQFAKRQLRERLIKEKSGRSALCPKPLTACRIPGAFADSFECIDTLAELESCGGCAQGFFNDNEAASGALGVDCTSLPGVARGGVTCSSGSCEVFACRPGWVLAAGSCVPT